MAPAAPPYGAGMRNSRMNIARRALARAALAAADPFVAVSALDDALKVARLEKKERGQLLFLRGQAVFAAASLDKRRASLFG